MTEHRDWYDKRWSELPAIRQMPIPHRTRLYEEHLRRDCLAIASPLTDEAVRTLRTLYELPLASLEGEAQSADPGRKDDQDKIRFELLPGDALRAIAVILTFGAKKYSDRNWEKGMHWSRPYGALQRHLTDWFEGKGLDEETGKSHLWHAGCCLLFLIAYELRGIGTDDRPIIPPGAS